MTQAEFRDRLQEITDKYTKARLNEQVKEISDLRIEYYHNIELVQIADPNNGFNCFALCFGIARSEKTQHLAKYCDIIPNSKYANYLIEQVLQEIRPNDSQDGDYVVYMHDNMPTHVGYFLNGRIVSKWGSFGHTWKHDLWEVPSSYGNEARYFRQLQKENCEKTYLSWTEQKCQKRN